MTVKLLQVGVGIRGSHWVEIVRDHPDVEAVGYVDPDPQAADRVRRVVGDKATVFPDLDAALGAVKADAALVVSPSALHAEHATRALDAGLAVMLEKPFALTVVDARRVLAKVRRRDGRFSWPRITATGRRSAPCGSSSRMDASGGSIRRR